MLKKIKKLALNVLFSSSGAALIVLCVMLLLSLFNLINTRILFSTNAWMLLMLPVAFLVPFLIFCASRGEKMRVPTLHLGTLKRVHIPTILFSTLLLILGSTLLKIAFFEGKYTEFSLYGAFFAHRNGSLWNDLYLVIAFCIVAPSLEGLLFRGALIKEHDRRGRLTATVFSSIFFALLGFSFEELAQRFFLGALLCIVLYATDSLALTVAMHAVYNIFAVFVEPMLISLKNISSNVALFVFLLAILTLAVAVCLFSHLSRLYRKYSHDRFGESFTRSTPHERTFWHLIELLLSVPAIACYVLFIIVSIILNI